MLDMQQIAQYAEQYYNDILHFCAQKLPVQDAEDVTQDVFLLLQHKAGELEEKNIRAWLYGVAARKTFEKYRENQKAVRHLTDLDSADTQALACVPEPEEKEQNFDIEALKAAILAKLSQAELELYKLVHIDKEKYADIAQKLNISTKAASVRIVRMREKIKKYVSELFKHI